MITKNDKIINKELFRENIFNFRVYLICKKVCLKHRIHKKKYKTSTSDHKRIG